MDSDKKSFIKKTLLGILGGGAISALYASHVAQESEEEDRKYRSGIGRNQIVVPLSKHNYLKALGRGETGSSRTKAEKAEKAVKDTDVKIPENVAELPKRDLDALKRSLLKRSSAPTEIRSQTAPVSVTSGFRKKSSGAVGATQIRNGKGQFAKEENLGKQAGILSDISGDAVGTIVDGAGALGGAMAGAFAVKALTDRIMVNRKKRQLDRVRRIYTDRLNKEINDEDEPYYRKTASDRGLLGQGAGFAALAGIGTASVMGLLVYKIMENRRKALADSADKDMLKYPTNKTVTFKFAQEKPDFFA